MATPIPDSYASASGKPIYAGRLAPVAEVIAQQFGKYRYQSPQLFQTSRATVEPTHLSGGPDWLNDGVGPNYLFVDRNGYWEWDHPGGDWIDATQTRQGSTPWFSVAAVSTPGVPGVNTYTVSCTSALQLIQTANRWNAFYVSASGGAGLGMATPFDTVNAKPSVAVTYVGGATATLACLIVAGSDGSTEQNYTTQAGIGAPLFVEFERPTAAVQSATMSFTITSHWYGFSPTINFFIVDPTINTEPVVTGIAYGAELDAGLVGHPDVINFPHRYEDGRPLSDFVLSGPAYSSGFNYDPYIYQGTAGPADTSGATYPSRGLGKIINIAASDGNTLVSSSYTGEGFEPLAPGLGALRLHLNSYLDQDPLKPLMYEGWNNNGYNGSGNEGYIFMPETLFGYLDHIFVRYYMRIGTPNGRPYRMPIAKRYQMSQNPTSEWIWAECAGKTGITPGHLCQGVNSAGSGGGHGFQLRSRWKDCTSDDNGPDVEGWNMGVHTYDFKTHNPVGYRYGDTDGFNDSFGAKGALGGMMYADKWYCIETELKLNTVMTGAPGFLPDGWIKVYVDGRLAMEKQNFVTRSLPLMYETSGGVIESPPVYDPGYVKSCREVGINAVWLSFYHGGMTQTTVDRTLFYTGIVCSHSYIGPMKFPAPSLPSWVPASGTIANVPEVNSFLSIDPGVSPANGWSFWAEGLNIGQAVPAGRWNAVIDAYSGGVYNPYFSVSGGPLGSMIYHGSGHGDNNWSGIVALDLNTLAHSIVKGGTLNGFPVDTVNCEFADGQPLAHHSYDNLVILGPEAGYPKGALAMPLMQAAGEASFNTNACHIYDFNNPGPGFVRKCAHDASIGVAAGGAAAYDPDLGRIWWKSNTNGIGYQQYFDLTTNQQVKLALGYDVSLPAPSPDSATMRYDSARKLLIMIDVCDATSPTPTRRRVYYLKTLNPTTLAEGWKEATLSTPFPDAGAGQGFAFDRSSDGTYLCNVEADTSKIYRLTIPTTLTDAWTVAPVTYAGVALNTKYVMGKRWSYVAALGAFINKGTAAQPMQVYRV